MGMSLRALAGAIEGLVAQAVDQDAAALVLDRRGVDIDLLAHSSIPVVLWEDEGPAQSPVDLVETCEWWTATAGAVERVRAAGYRRPAAILTPAVLRHWHDDIRLACIRSCGLPALEYRNDEEAVVAFLDEHRPDALVIGVPTVATILQRRGLTLPLVTLIAFDDIWFRAYAGWVSDQDHRGQVTLELIEQRLRYGPRPPRRIVIPPRWQEGTSLPIKS